MEVINKLRSIFSRIADPRSDINKLHKLDDILLIGIISVICAADTWKDMETFAKGKEDFLRTFLDLPNGIHSDDTFNRVFRKRIGNASQNFSILSKIALNLLIKETNTKQGIKGKRLKAAYDQNYLIKIINMKV